MEVKLVMTGGKGAAQEVVVTGPRFFIGRAEDCQLRPRSDLISRHHCVILQDEGLLLVRDLGSKNGTFVNGHRVVTEAELHSGDVLKVGPLEFEVRVVGAPEPAPQAAKPTPAAPPELPTKKPKVRSVQEAAARTVRSATGPADEDDVSNWLYEDEVSSSLTETASMEPTRTAKAPAAAETAKPAEPPKPADEEEIFEGEEPEEKPKSRTEAFQIPTKPKGPATGSSKESAADALKSFFKRK